MRESDFTRISKEQATSIPTKEGVYQVVKDRYWLVDKDANILILRKTSIQCSLSKEISEGMLSKLLESDGHPGVAVMYLETVYLPLEVHSFTYQL